MGLERLISDTSLIKLLEDGIAKGYWTLADLDKPPPGWYFIDQPKPWTNPLRNVGWTDEPNQLPDDF